MAKRDEEEEKNIEHTHSWFIRPTDLSAEYCQCGAILVSRQEYERRQEEWDQYWQGCQNTKAADTLMQMMKAVKEHNLVRVAELRREIRDATHGEEYVVERKKEDGGVEERLEYRVLEVKAPEMEAFRPHFPEPELFPKYEIKENVDKPGSSV